MRLIDADALIEDINNRLWDWETVDTITSTTVLNQTITDIRNEPTIEAIPISWLLSLETKLLQNELLSHACTVSFVVQEWRRFNSN